MKTLATRRIVWIIICLISAPFAYSQDSKSDEEPLSKVYYEKIKELEGIWQGPYEWTGAKTGNGKLKVKYSTTGYGSSIVEDIIAEDGTVSMTSVYHMDSDDLRMTHYCAANNHPRLIAKSMDNSGKYVDFEMVDITNLKSKDSGHVYGVRLEWISAQKLNIIFKYRSGDAKSRELIQLNKLK